jgi:hypothetical protein
MQKTPFHAVEGRSRLSLAYATLHSRSQAAEARSFTVRSQDHLRVHESIVTRMHSLCQARKTAFN